MSGRSTSDCTAVVLAAPARTGGPPEPLRGFGGPPESALARAPGARRGRVFQPAPPFNPRRHGPARAGAGCVGPPRPREAHLPHTHKLAHAPLPRPHVGRLLRHGGEGGRLLAGSSKQASKAEVGGRPSTGTAALAPAHSPSACPLPPRPHPNPLEKRFLPPRRAAGPRCWPAWSPPWTVRPPPPRWRRRRPRRRASAGPGGLHWRAGSRLRRRRRRWRRRAGPEWAGIPIWR